MKRAVALDPDNWQLRLQAARIFRGAGDDEAATQELGVRWGTMQCRELLDSGVPGLHFYTLNKSSATRQIYENLFTKD